MTICWVTFLLTIVFRVSLFSQWTEEGKYVVLAAEVVLTIAFLALSYLYFRTTKFKPVITVGVSSCVMSLRATLQLLETEEIFDKHSDLLSNMLLVLLFVMLTNFVVSHKLLLYSYNFVICNLSALIYVF